MGAIMAGTIMAGTITLEIITDIITDITGIVCDGTRALTATTIFM
jgi:L-cysteine desulfidase